MNHDNQPKYSTGELHQSKTFQDVLKIVYKKLRRFKRTGFRFSLINLTWILNHI